MGDEELLAGLGAGDAELSAAFIRRFERRVYGLAVRMLFDRGAADDVAQEVFVRAWRHAGSYDRNRGTVSAWLLRITRNLAVDELRRRHPEAMDPDIVAVRVPATAHDTVANAVVAADSASQAAASVRMLPSNQRRAVALSLYGGLTADEIGRLDGVPVGTVKSRIRRGLHRVREGTPSLSCC